MKHRLSKRVLALLLTLVMVLSMLPTVFAENTTPFVDVGTNRWYTDAVNYVYEHGLMAGTDATHFSPLQTVSRAMVVTILYRADGSPEVEFVPKFTDVKAHHWFKDAVMWAVETGITKGTSDTTFTPNADITREELATFLYRFAQYKHYDVSASADLSVFPDANKVHSYAVDAMKWAVGSGIIHGEAMGEGRPPELQPRANAIRAQLAVMIQRFMEAQSLAGKTVILHTNDTHGALLGFAQVAKVKHDFEDRGATVILTDAGDFSQGTTYVSTSKGEAAVTVMNAAGYDFVTLGNHEFDFGYAQLMQNLDKAEFKPIVADVLLKETGKSILDGSTVCEVEGVKIGFFGMETPETFTKVNPGLIQEITFPMGEEMYACAQTEINTLKANGADLVIGLVHLGVDDESEPNRSIDLYSHVTGVDFLIDGHSHTVMTAGPNDEPIQSTGTKASETALMNVGLIQIDNATKTIEKNELIPLGENAPADPDVAAVAQAIMDEVDAQYGQVFATSEVELNGDKAPGNRNMETNLGDLITDSMLWTVLKEGELEVPTENVVAITNGGGIRAWIHAGDVTMNDVHTVLPFGNTIAVVYVTGAELLEALEASTYSTPGAVGGFPQVAGMQYTIDTGKAFDEGDYYPDSTYHMPASIQRVTINEINGQAFDPAATYAVVTNNFCAAGGDTYYVFKNASAQFDTSIPMDEALMGYITDELGAVIGETYAEPQGRIIIETPAPSTDFAILSTTDIHGKAWDTNILTDGTEFNSILSMKTAINTVREALGRENVFVLDNGDLYQGNPVSTVQLNQITTGESDLPAVMAMCLADIGYTAASLGNHEWNYPWTTMQSIRAYLAEQGVPSICANLYTEDGEPFFTPYLVKTIAVGDQTLKIGVLGLENTDCTRWDVPDNYPGISFHHPENTASSIVWEYNHWLPRLQEEGCDFIVVVYHGGRGSTSGELTFGVNTEDQGARLISETSGIDMVIMGHDHSSSYSNTKIQNKDGEDVLVVNAGGQDVTKSVFTATLGDDGKIAVTLKSSENLKMRGPKDSSGQYTFNYQPDPELKEKVRPYAEAAIAFVNQPIGKAIDTWDTINDYYLQQCDTMDIIADAQIYMGTRYMENKYADEAAREALYTRTGLDHLEVDMSTTSVATNPGSFYMKAGDMTVKTIFQLYKYDNNTLYLLALTGQQIKDVLEQNAATRYSVTVANGQATFSQIGDFYTCPITGGLNFVYDMAQPEGERVVIDGFANGKAFELDKTYVVAVNSYHLGNPGCGFGAYSTTDAVFSQLNDLGGGSVPDLLTDYVREISAAEGGVSPNRFNWTWALTYSGDLNPEVPLEGDVYGKLTTDFADGAKMLIYYNAGSTVVSQNKAGDTPRIAPANATVSGEYLAASNEAAVFDVKAEGEYEGYTVYSLKIADGYLTSGETGNSLAYEQELTDMGKWYAVPVEGGLHIMNVGANYNDNHNQALEYYQTGFTTYGVKNTDAYLFNLYEQCEKPGEEPEEGITFPSTSNDDIAKYGNIFTNLDGADFFADGFAWGDIVTVKFLDQELALPVVPTFSYVDQGTPGVFVSKDGETGEPVGRVFMAINMGDFATTYGLAYKTTNADKTYFWTACEGVEFPVPVTIEMLEQGGYATEMAIRDINRTNNRADYPELTDEEFANFRQITTTGMGDHLYRGSSPINPEIGRNTYADAALQNAGVTVIMNLANDQATAEAYEGFADTYYSQQNVIYLNLGVDFQAPDFQAGLANGLRHFAANEGVYYVHCTEGKDRAGFVSALLECFMGATYDEVVADYLKTYTNYYTVVDGVQQPLSQETLDAIANSNIIKTLQTAFGVEDLAAADLAAEAEEYIKAIGLTDEETAALRANLGGAYVPDTRLQLVENANDMLKYGHLVIDISTADLLEQFAYGDIVTVTVEGYGEIDAPICSNYDDVNTGEALIRAKSGKDTVNLAINYGQIGVQFGIIEKAPEGSSTAYQVKEGVTFPIYVTIEMKEAGGYADELAVRAMNRDDNHANRATAYPTLTDAEYANFRAVTTTGMGENTLYRSSSPINSEIGRNAEADAAARDAGIKAFMNMADTQAEAEAYEGYDGTYYATQTQIFLGMPVAFTTDEFKAGLAEGYRFIADTEGPALIHCTEGKDRTGLGIAVLEAFMGASLEEIQNDYLQTYINYYNVVDGVQQALTDAQTEAVRNIITNNLGIVFEADLTTADLADEAAAYLTEIGLTADEQEALRARLAGETEPEPQEVYALASALQDGDQVVIYSQKNGAAVLNEVVSGKFTEAAVAVADGKITNPDAAIVWTVIANPSGTYSFKNKDDEIVRIGEGYTAALSNDPWADDANEKWALETVSENTFRMKSYDPTGLTNLYLRNTTGPAMAIQNTTEVTSEDYSFQFYVYDENAGGSDPEPTTSYEVAETVEDGDQIIMVYTVGDKFYAMTDDNSTANMLKVVEVTFTDGVLNTPDDSAVFTLATGSAAGSFLLKGAGGLYVNRVSGTAVNMKAEASDWTLTLGEGASKITFATESTRCLFIRDNSPLQIRCYSTQNWTAANYYSTATIYKVVTNK